MLRVGIVGCGKIADAHVAQIRRIAGCEIVGVCDREPLMAEQLCDRFAVGGCYTDVARLLEHARPEVVHITTPPESHFGLAKLCLEHDRHVYVEKPFTLYAHEAEQLIDLARAKGLKLTAGHNDQFTHVARRMRSLIATGYLGSRIVHMESYYGYDLGDASYARALLGDKEHWARRLPGKLLQNVISHGIARIAEFLTSASPSVTARGFCSPVLSGIGEGDLVDELRVIISEESGTTAYFTFSSQMRPSLHEFRIYGDRNGILLDQDHEMLLPLRGAKYKSYADKFIPTAKMAVQCLRNVSRNAQLFLKMDFHMESGMKYLIEAFYRSIRENTAPPISYREIVLTANIMEAIFLQMSTNHRKVMSQNVSLEKHCPAVL